MSEQTALHIERADAVATVWLARPQVRNAFNDVMVAELTACFEQLATDAHVRVIILAARGPAFCAGADLAWMQRMSRFSEAENLADARALARMLHTLYTCPKPVIARVHGDAYAGGLGLVAASDVAVAADAARFCLSEVKLGLIAATIAPYVVRTMGERQARRYVLSAEVFDASAAQRIGLVHSAVAPEALDAEVSRIAQAFLAASPAAIASAKSLLREIAQRPIDEALIELTATRIAQARASADGQEGIAAFLEKRQAAWVWPGGEHSRGKAEDQ